MFEFCRHSRILFSILIFVSVSLFPFSVHASVNNESAVEIMPNKQELARMGNWADKDCDALLNDAIKGDEAALFMVGYAFLTGRLGQSINVESANMYFSMSASLGFPLALNQITLMYIHDKNDPFLSLIYLNLAASYDHPELLKSYHDLRAKLIVNFGPEGGQRIAAEIERIAEEKRMKIEKNKKDIKRPENMTSEFNKVLFTENIIHEDLIYTHDYWESIFEGNTRE